MGGVNGDRLGWGGQRWWEEGWEGELWLKCIMKLKKNKLKKDRASKAKQNKRELSIIHSSELSLHYVGASASRCDQHFCKMQSLFTSHIYSSSLTDARIHILYKIWHDSLFQVESKWCQKGIRMSWWSFSLVVDYVRFLSGSPHVYRYHLLWTRILRALRCFCTFKFSIILWFPIYSYASQWKRDWNPSICAVLFP